MGHPGDCGSVGVRGLLFRLLVQTRANGAHEGSRSTNPQRKEPGVSGLGDGAARNTDCDGWAHPTVAACSRAAAGGCLRHSHEVFWMKNVVLIGIWGMVGWLFLRTPQNRNVIPAEEAAEKLREAWGDTHEAA